MADTETLDRKIKVVLERLQALLEQAGGPPDERAPLVDAAAVLSASLEELRRVRAEAESRLEERTAELAQANAALQAEVAGRRQAADEAQSLARFPAENPSPVFRLSKEGMLLYANDACGKVLGDWGCEVGDLAPLFWRDLAAGIFAGGSARTVDIPVGDRVYSFAVVPVAEAGYVNLYGQDATQRVRAEEQLRESEERFHSLYITMAEGMALHEVVYDGQGEAIDYTILDVNPVFEAIAGLPREQSVGRKASDLYGTGEPPYLEPYARVAASGEPTSFETYFPPMEKHFSISVFSPGPGRFATVFSDITERVRAAEERERLLANLQAQNEELQSQAEELEAQTEELRSQAEELHAQTLDLEEERARLRAIIDNVPEAILVADEGGQVVLANPAAGWLFGWPKDYGQVVRYHADRRGEYAPDDLPIFRAAVYGEVRRDVPMALPRPEGDWRAVLAGAVPILDANGQAHGAVGVYRDITDLMQAQETLHYQAYLLENTSDAIISSDAAFVIRSWNQAAEEIYGWRAGEVIGRSAGEVLQAEFDEPAEEVTRRFFAEGYWRGEVVHRRKDGTPVHILGAVRLLRDEAGNPSVVVSANRDITDRKQVEAQRDAMLEELKAALAEKEVLIREIYHRVKNNVQALIYLMEMQGEYIEDPGALGMIRELQDRAQTMALVHEKLYQSRNLAQIDFGDYLRDLVAHLSHALWTDRLLTWQIDVENAWIGVDTAIPCGLIVNELLTNALKYAFPDGHPCVERGETECQVCVEFRTGQDEFTLVVGDNGVGLPPGIDWTATKSLGLQLIDILVHHQLGGQIKLDNQAGATFTITFPEREHGLK